MFRDEQVAEMQVVTVIDFDIHLRRDMSGQRYIEKITECYREAQRYRERVVMEYRNGKYVSVEPISEQMRVEMAREMIKEDAVAFEQFLGTYWGGEIGA
ncbi:hypothetical protein D3C77_461300 [compost metagenome]